MIDFDILYNKSKLFLGKQLVDKHIETELLPPIKKQEQQTSLDNLVMTSSCNLMIGNGGSGKTSTLLSYWSELCNKSLENSKKIPIYIRAADLNNNEKYPNQTLIEYIKWNYFEFENVINIYNVRNAFINYINNNVYDYKVILLIDAIDEIHDKSVRNKLWMDIECYLNQDAFSVLITSRLQENNFAYPIENVQVCSLEKPQIINYLKKNNITLDNEIDLSLLFYNPMYLTLYVKAYSENIEKETISGDLTENVVLHYFFNNQLIKHNSDEIIFIIKLLLPIMCYYTFINNKHIGNSFSVRSIMEKALNICLSDKFVSCFISLGIEDSKISFMNTNIDAWIITFAKTCTKIMYIFNLDGNYYSWCHSFFCDWFTCQGVILALKQEINSEKKVFNYVANKIDLINDIFIRQETLKFCEYFYLELQKQVNNINCKKEFIAFLVKLTYLYDDLRRDKEVYVIAMSILAYFENEEIINLYEDKVELAEHINGTAYSLVHLKDKSAWEMLNIINYAKEKFDIAMKLIANDNSDFALKTTARIWGNIGAYYITLHKLSIILAKENHKNALKIRENLLQKINEKDLIEDKATSYTCLATDCFYMGEYINSVEYHRKAIEIRKNEGKKVINYNRAVGAMTYAILLAPYNNSFSIENVLKYLEISIELIESKGEFGELREWKDRFFGTINILPLVDTLKREQNINLMKGLILKFEKICNSKYINSYNYTELFNEKIKNLKFKGDFIDE